MSLPCRITSTEHGKSCRNPGKAFLVNDDRRVFQGLLGPRGSRWRVTLVWMSHCCKEEEHQGGFHKTEGEFSRKCQPYVD